MRMYTSSRAKRKRFRRKSEFQLFLLICSRPIGVPPRYTNMASPYKALYSCVKRLIWANNSETVYRIDLRLGEVVFVLVFYIISFSWLLLLNGFKFVFLWRDSENDARSVGSHVSVRPSVRLYLRTYRLWGRGREFARCIWAISVFLGGKSHEHRRF